MTEMMNVNTELNLDELEEVSGGKSAADGLHNLKNFSYRTVCGVVHYDSTACLTLRRTPNGAIIQGVGWQNGDRILVHKTYREDGWYFAYDTRKKVYGYVNPKNVR